MASPVAQFEIKTLIPIEIGGVDLSFTNASAFMVLAVAVICGFLLIATSKRSLIPGRLQAGAELLHDFAIKTLRDNTGDQGLQFFPLVFSLFTFILAANLIGMLPYSFTVTSHIAVTFALAILVFVTVTLYGIFRHGFGFLRLFLPDGVPPVIAPLIVPIEIVSYLSRPVGHSVRLFAVMLAGHITLKVFAGFVGELLGAGTLGVFGAILPLGMTIAMTALEILMCLIQAYVFTMLTCMYLNDAIHPSH